MKHVKFLIVLLLSTLYVFSQQSRGSLTNQDVIAKSVNPDMLPFPIPKISVEEAMKNLRVKKDEFNGFDTYTSDRTPKDVFDVDRLFISRNQYPNGTYFMNLFIFHNELSNLSNNYQYIETIQIKTDNNFYTINAEKYTNNNGTNHSYYRHSFGGNSDILYKIVNDLANSKISKVRFVGRGRQLDFEVSTREKKALMDVLLFQEANKTN